MLIVVMLNVVILCFVTLNVVILYFVMLSVIDVDCRVFVFVISAECCVFIVVKRLLSVSIFNLVYICGSFTTFKALKFLQLTNDLAYFGIILNSMQNFFKVVISGFGLI